MPGLVSNRQRVVDRTNSEIWYTSQEFSLRYNLPFPHLPVFHISQSWKATTQISFCLIGLITYFIYVYIYMVANHIFILTNWRLQNTMHVSSLTKWAKYLLTVGCPSTTCTLIFGPKKSTAMELFSRLNKINRKKNFLGKLALFLSKLCKEWNKEQYHCWGLGMFWVCNILCVDNLSTDMLRADGTLRCGV